MTNVFVDGSAGTTGLNILERLAGRQDIALLTLPEERRKDESSRREMLNAADLVFLCLPDAAAREAVSWLKDPSVRVIDTSTAHRTAPGWVYGFPELSGQRERIMSARLVANPGCHASGFIALARPLAEEGMIPPDTALTSFSLTGYSGGGKKMIAEYEAPDRPALLDAPRMYGLGQTHKHLPEMQALCGLDAAPAFCPVVAPYYAGMEVVVPLFRGQCKAAPAEIAACYEAYYRCGLVRYTPADSEGGFLSANALQGTDELHVTVCGNGERILLVARFDNLGKGACGAAIQNMNLMTGRPEYEGLRLMEDMK